MIDRSTLRTFSAALAAVALLLAAAGTADAARVNRSPAAGTTTAATTTTKPGQAAPNYGGYGRGWCYWHPYRCYYR